MYKVVKKRLGDIVNFKRGYDLPSYKRREGVYPIISSGGISGYHDEYKRDGEGVVTGRYGTLGEMYYVNGRYWPHNTALYATDFKENYPKYVYYLMKCLGSLKTSDKSTVPGINRNDLHEINIPYIEPRFQKDVADFLSALDSKIELNNRINAELEAMAKLLYDYWFVQFDFPDENGKPYKSSGGEMVFNKTLKREIPKGWEVKKLGKVLKTILGGTPSTKKREYWESGVHNWLNSGEIANFPVISSELKITNEAVKNSAAALMPKGTTAISITRHIRPTILAVDACANQSVIGILETSDFKSSYIYSYIKNEVPRYLSLRTGAQQPHINKNIVDNTLFVVPKIYTLENYYKVANPIYEKIINNSFQNQELAALRDWLLPMLMNGQVRVADVEQGGQLSLL
jgi:type I restriction enzyme S subunit